MENVLYFFRRNWLRFLIAFLIGAILYLIYVGVQGQWASLFYAANGTAIAWVTLLGIGLLAIISGSGFFNMFSYYFRRKRLPDKKHESYGDYVERRKLERDKSNPFFLCYFIISALFFIAWLILFLLNQNA